MSSRETLSRKVRLDFDSKCSGYQVQVGGFTSNPILGGDGQSIEVEGPRSIVAGMARDNSCVCQVGGVSLCSSQRGEAEQRE